jgi:hypothetical protein
MNKLEARAIRIIFGSLAAIVACLLAGAIMAGFAVL